VAIAATPQARPVLASLGCNWSIAVRAGAAAPTTGCWSAVGVTVDGFDDC
jgi:hypothetical protein